MHREEPPYRTLLSDTTITTFSVMLIIMLEDIKTNCSIHFGPAVNK